MEKTAYELHMSDWSSDVCSSDLYAHHGCGPYHVQRGHCWNPKAGDCWKQNKQTGNRRHRPTAQAIAQQCNQGNKSDPWNRLEKAACRDQDLKQHEVAKRLNRLVHIQVDPVDTRIPVGCGSDGVLVCQQR